jgi:hypothetical protein
LRTARYSSLGEEHAVITGSKTLVRKGDFKKHAYGPFGDTGSRQPSPVSKHGIADPGCLSQILDSRHFKADPDTAFHFHAYPDHPTFHFHADPDPAPQQSNANL